MWLLLYFAAVLCIRKSVQNVMLWCLGTKDDLTFYFLRFDSTVALVALDRIMSEQHYSPWDGGGMDQQPLVVAYIGTDRFAMFVDVALGVSLDSVGIVEVWVIASLPNQEMLDEDGDQAMNECSLDNLEPKSILPPIHALHPLHSVHDAYRIFVDPHYNVLLKDNIPHSPSCCTRYCDVAPAVRRWWTTL
jgi:hypothetical protein